MSIDVVVELSRELHRIAVAGVGLVRDDHRIAALLPALERSGERVPVFARIAERTSALLAASSGDAPASFLQLNTLVGAVLKAQGRADVEGELESLPAATTSARPIPMGFVNHARSWHVAGCPDFLHDAVERGWFGDVRLARFAIEALHDANAELANLAAERMVPAYGRGIVPLLVATLDLSEKRPAARAIEAICRADADDGAALARQILDPGADRAFALVTDGVEASDAALAAALGGLGDGAVDRGLLADHLGAKRKALRTAALRRLLVLGDAGAEAHAVAMLGGSVSRAREAIESLPALTDGVLSDLVVARAKALAASLGEGRSSSEEANDAARVLGLLARSDPGPARFDAAMVLLEHVDVLQARASALRDVAIDALLERLFEGCPAARRETLVRRVLSLAPADVTLAAIARFGPRDALPLLDSAGRSDFHRGLRDVFSEERGASARREGLPPPSEWDERWLTLGLRRGLFALVEYLGALRPARVTEHALSRRVSCPEELALVALALDPGVAGALRSKLDEETEHAPVFDALCAVIAEGDRARAIELVGAVPRRFGPTRIDALRARLTDGLDGLDGTGT